MHTRATTTTFGPADIQSLFDGHLEDLRSMLTLTKLHLWNHRYDMDADTRLLWADQIGIIVDAITFLACENCEHAAVIRHASGEYYCAKHDAEWAECDRCHDSTLIADLCSVGSSDALLCPGCVSDEGGE